MVSNIYIFQNIVSKCEIQSCDNTSSIFLEKTDNCELLESLEGNITY